MNTTTDTRQEPTLRNCVRCGREGLLNETTCAGCRRAHETAPGRPGLWVGQALCVGADPELWYDDQPEHPGYAAAKTICRSCPVTTECLDRALAEEAHLPRSEKYGIRGGLDPDERQARTTGKPVQRRRRKPVELTWTPERRSNLRDAVAKEGTVAAAARKLGISPCVAYSALKYYRHEEAS